MMEIKFSSISQKLLFMVLVANLVTLVTAGCALFYQELKSNNIKAISELTTLTNIIGQGSLAALEFNDPKVASENLGQLQANPNIIAAALYSQEGKLFATYGKNLAENPLPAPQSDSYSFSGDRISVFHSIYLGEKFIGTVYISELYNVGTWLKDYLWILSLVLLASLFLGLLISSRLQYWISKPIQDVSGTARQVMSERNYGLRAPQLGRDEIGQLAEDFNGMLETLEHEIAERRHAENEIRFLNAQLEKRVIERTKELEIANEALRTRTEEAETANRAKADFLANMSHEIRTPMNAILGFAYLLEQNELDDDAALLVRKIRTAGRTLQSIINDILDFSKIEAGRLEFEKSPFHLVDILENIGAIMAANAGDKDIELVITPAPDLNGQLKGDALRLEQVLINLTSNAIKFTDKGSVVVAIDIIERKDNIVTLKFSVKDTGIGIAEEKQSQIFAAFSQADISTTRRFGGTGLGLTICRHLIAGMGGDIGVNSTPGIGSEFWFTLSFDFIHSQSLVPPELSALDVLIVDDNPIARESLSLIAQSVGWHPTQAESGTEALQKIHRKQNQKNQFNVLLIDWKMPSMDGLEVASQIKTNFTKNTAPIILMVTAYSREDLLQEPSTKYIDGILEKPVTSSVLYNTVAEVLQSRGTRSFTLELLNPEIKSKRLEQIKVLVVDDSETNREVAMRILRSEGASVSLANDGREAINYVQKNIRSLDVILMDVQMPIMDGYEATQQIRLMPEYQDIPIIALTAGAFKTQQDAAREAGMNAFVTKPFNVDELVSTIQKLTCPTGPQLQTAAALNITPTEQKTHPPLAGINIAQGINIWLDISVYQKYLIKFLEDFGSSTDRINQLYLSGDFSGASSLCHKIKGVAGNLALTDVYQSASKLESARNPDRFRDLFDKYQESLAIALDSIRTFTQASSSDASSKPTPENADVSSVLADLLAALDMDTPDLANHLLDNLSEILPLNTLQPVRLRLDEFDFRGAESQVHTLARELKIEL